MLANPGAFCSTSRRLSSHKGRASHSASHTIRAKSLGDGIPCLRFCFAIQSAPSWRTDCFPLQAG